MTSANDNDKCFELTLEKDGEVIKKFILADKATLKEHSIIPLTLTTHGYIQGVLS
jgi:hypothetical protein